MKDGRIVSDHRLDDPLEEDLRTLAYSRLGQALLGKNKNQFDTDGLTAEEQQMLRRLLTRVGDGDADAP